MQEKEAKFLSWINGNRHFRNRALISSENRTGIHQISFENCIEWNGHLQIFKRPQVQKIIITCKICFSEQSLGVTADYIPLPLSEWEVLHFFVR